MFGLCLCHRTKNLLALEDFTVFDINSNEWKQIYILPFKATACTKLHWFQFRINHNILATNYFLKKIKIIDDANCNFCQKENETIEHIFWGCENVQNLLGQIISWFSDKDINQTFLKKTLIFGDVDKVYKDDVYNAILLNIKYYIYTNRCLKESSLKMFGLCLCHRTKNLLALADFVHFHNPKKCVQWFHFPFGKNYNLHHQ
jgi:hypothetical protein